MPRTLLSALLVLLLAAAGCSPLTFTLGGDPADNALRTRTVGEDGRWGSDRVAIVDVSGIIHHGEAPGLLGAGENPVSLLEEKLAQAAADPRVKAVILRLNTPGGTVTASDAMYRQVRRFRRQTRKPVVTLMMDVAASGGYYLACATDEVVAHPTSVTGSIGVIMQTVSVKPGLERIGVHTEAITSGPNKEAGSPLSELTPQHREVLRRMVDDFYGRFVAVVREARPQIPEDRFGEVTDGRIVSGADALALGLVDSTGDLYDAFARAKQRAGIARADLVMYHRPHQWVGSPHARAPALPAGTQINLLQLNIPDARRDGAGFYYLWDPELMR